MSAQKKITNSVVKGGGRETEWRWLKALLKLERLGQGATRERRHLYRQ